MTHVLSLFNITTAFATGCDAFDIVAQCQETSRKIALLESAFHVPAAARLLTSVTKLRSQQVFTIIMYIDND